MSTSTNNPALWPELLWELAKQENVAVVLLSQLRCPEGGVNTRPDMLQLKEAGNLAALSHCVLLLYIPAPEDGSLRGEQANVVIGKNRKASPGPLPTYFDNELRFYVRKGNAGPAASGGQS